MSEAATREAQFGVLPLLPGERVWGFADFTWVNVGLAIATWAFLIGGAMAATVDLRTGIAAAIIGNAISVALMALATCPPSARWGLEQYTFQRSVFGPRGVLLVVGIWLIVVETGWAAVLSIMFGRSTAHLVGAATDTSIDPDGLLVSALAAVAIVLTWLVLARGALSMRFVNRVIAPGLFLVQFGMAALLVQHYGLDGLLALRPPAATADAHLDFMQAVELNLAAGFSWWPVMGSLARVTRTKQASFWPNTIGLFGAAVLGEVVGLAAGLALGDSDPTAWMLPLGGLLAGAVALVWIALANVTSAASIVYATCIALRQLGGAAAARLPWTVLTGGFLVLPLLLGLWPGVIYDRFSQFLVLSGVAFAPLAAVCAADYFLLRRQRVDLRGIYANHDEGASSPYAFFAGFNPAALLAVVLGSATYVLLLDPVTFEMPVPGFRWLTASLPAFAVAGLAHLLLTRLWVRRSGLGGYD